MMESTVSARSVLPTVEQKAHAQEHEQHGRRREHGHERSEDGDGGSAVAGASQPLDERDGHRHQVAKRGEAPQHAQRAEQLQRQRHALPVGHAPLVVAIFGHTLSPSLSDGAPAPPGGGAGLSARSFLKPRMKR